MGRIEKSVDIQAPIDKCYRVLTHPELFPTFLKHITAIRAKGTPNVWHWEVTGPEGKPIEWDLELDAIRHDNRILSWHTVRNADVAHSGAITLEPLGADRTRLHFVVEHTPLIRGTGQGEFVSEFKHPGEKIGPPSEAEQRIEENLHLLQQAIEGGNVPVSQKPGQGTQGEGI